MLVLAYDTATLQSSIGWIRTAGDGDDSVVDSAALSRPAAPGHAETLVPRITEILATGGHSLGAVELVVCGIGPGTFTGLRIGLSTAKGLALAGGIPLVGLSSLEALAISAPGAGPIAALIDARRGQLYAAAYDVVRDGGVPRATAIVPEQLVEPDALPALLSGAGIVAPVRLAGNGAVAYRERLAALGPPPAAEDVAPNGYWLAIAGLARYRAVGAADPHSIEPVYQREPDARLPGRQ